MISMQLAELAQCTHGQLHGDDGLFSSVSTDSRTLARGELFVALTGPSFDGHDFVEVARQRGASALLVERVLSTPLPQVQVDNTRRGLGDLAAAWRQRSEATVVGITGSNGKTTLKEMISAILSQQHSVLCTQGNLNNDIGMPLTLLRMQDEHYAVIEMGANHSGEIAYLSNIACPDVAVLNNAGRAHLEGFGSLEGVARAKGEIIQGLRQDGIFICNADDRFASSWRSMAAKHKVIDFGVRQQAMIHSPVSSYRVEWHEQGFDAHFEVHTPDGVFEVAQGLAGEHNRMNALAAIAACSALSISEEDMQAGLRTLKPVPGRLAPRMGCSGSRLIDDSYNANPDSVIAALDVLKHAPGRRTLVLGDLGELGQTQRQLHAELGEQANVAEINRVITCGELSAAASDAFAGESQHFDSQQTLIDFLLGDLNADDSVLIKGSRASAMDKVVDALSQEVAAC